LPEFNQLPPARLSVRPCAGLSG